jgi:CMP-N-acetylneuraminic acid synthetase
MKNPDEILYIVQARLGSQRVPSKMIRPFADSNLFEIAIQKILKSTIIPKDQFYVSIYEPELHDIADEYRVNIYNRSERSAKSEGTPLSEIYEWWDMPGYKNVVLISACCPLLKIETIDAFCKYYQNIDNDGLFGVIKKKTFYWNEDGDCITPFSDGERIMNTKTVKPMYEAGHCLYASRLNLIPQGLWMGTFTKDNPKLFELPEYEVFDIDYEWQFKVAELLYKNG